MHIGLAHPSILPAQFYGGTERVIVWLARKLKEHGHKVSVYCHAESKLSFVDKVIAWNGIDFSCFENNNEDIVHFFQPPRKEPEFAHLVTVGGNGKCGERFLRNTVFVSQNHARRHGSDVWVYNGVDPNEYVFESKPQRRLSFLAKASWRVKNVSGAIRISRKSGYPLDVMGGQRPFYRFFDNHVKWHGMVSGEQKNKILPQSSALLFPVLWHEPFGLAVIEALLCGVPVFASPFGSLPELLKDAGAGKICASEEEFILAIEDIGKYDRRYCREYAIKHFSHRQMTENYLGLYEKVIQGRFLNEKDPVSLQDAGQLLALADK